MSDSSEDKREDGDGGPAGVASEAFLAGILKLVPDAIIVIDEKQLILIFNRGAEYIFDYQEEEVLGWPLEMLIPDRLWPHHGQHIKAFSGSGVTARYKKNRHQIIGLRKNGEEFPAEASITKCSLDGGTVFATVLRDISERSQTEENLRRRAHEMERFNRLTIGRELRMINLKKEVNNLLKQTRHEEKYKINIDDKT